MATLEIATTQFLLDQMQAWTLKKDFLSSLCPTDPFVYLELPPLDGEERLLWWSKPVCLNFKGLQ